MPKGGTYHQKSSSFFEKAKQSVGRWIIKPSKRCFEIVREICTANPEEAGSMDKCQKKMTDKGREYRKKILNKKRTNLVSRIIRKSSEIDVLLYSHQNNVTVKEKLAQLSDIFKLIEDINQEMTELDDNSTEELWSTDIDEKVFSFKHKVHNWLKEGDEMQRIEKNPRSSCSRSTSSKSSSRSSSSKSSKLSTKERAIEEKVRLADLQAEATLMQQHIEGYLTS